MKELNLEDFIIGTISFAIGGTILLAIILTEMSGSLQFTFDNFYILAALFAGMLFLAVGLQVMIKTALE
jgi:hypothetical protein